MRASTFRRQIRACTVGLALLACVGLVRADPPARVARVGAMNGAVSLSAAGENDWVQATINRPLTTGDRLWAPEGARAEVQIGGGMVRMGAQTGVSLLRLDDQIAQLQLTQGTLIVRMSRFEADQAFEVDTPNLAFTLRQAGEYRIEVDPEGLATTLIVRKGAGEAAGDEAQRVVDARQPLRFTGTGLQQEALAAPQADALDRWSAERDRALAGSVSARYVSPDLIGYQDLDANGSWRVDPNYGNVWVPRRVAAGWAPYRDGHWAWVDPWGWTWVDDAPWGFAVSHYGRWARLNDGWAWVPGPLRSRAYYAPALVAFVGGANFQVAVGCSQVGGVAWFPLAPREVYRPAYTVSRGYYENVNRSNTIISNTVIVNNYNRPDDHGDHANRRVPGAVIAVPRTTFVQSQPVARSIVQVARAALAAAPVAALPQVAPAPHSGRDGAPEGARPPARAFERPVVARAAPPAAHPGPAAQQPQPGAGPGRPPDEAARRGPAPAASARAPAVTVPKPPDTRPPEPGATPPGATAPLVPRAARPAANPASRPAATPVAKPAGTPAVTSAPAAATRPVAPPAAGPARTPALTPRPAPQAAPPQAQAQAERERRLNPAPQPPAAAPAPDRAPRPAAPVAAPSPPPAPAPHPQPPGRPSQRPRPRRTVSEQRHRARHRWPGRHRSGARWLRPRTSPRQRRRASRTKPIRASASRKTAGPEVGRARRVKRERPLKTRLPAMRARAHSGAACRRPAP
jgi:hypothetical protein